MFDRLTGMNEEMLELRSIVIDKKQPRQVFVQANTFCDDEGNVTLKSYEPSAEGIIQSYLDRFSD